MVSEPRQQDLAERAGPRAATAQAMVPPGVETLVGVARDVTFGPLVVFGAGGVVTDLLGDRISSDGTYGTRPRVRPCSLRCSRWRFALWEWINGLTHAALD